MTNLVYLPLDRPQGFRLLEIRPGAADEPLRLDLIHSVLDMANPPSFEALSYVWGHIQSPATALIFYRPEGTVEVESKITIGQNLATALKHLRHPFTARIVWADAICINQEDITERTQQVLMMADIYRLACQVVAFLEPEANNSSQALDLVAKLGNTVDVNFSTGVIQSSISSADEPGWADQHEALPFSRQEFLFIHHLVNREWFDRLWVRQEIGLGGTKGILQCGNKQVHWPNFCRGIFLMYRKPIAKNSVGLGHLPTLPDRLRLIDTIVLHAMQSFFYLPNLRLEIGQSKCSDPRDRIYGILSQLYETKHIKIIPDYSKSVVDVYTEITQRRISYFLSLDIISQCELDDHASALPLPIWVPDWSIPRRTRDLHVSVPALFHSMKKFSFIDGRLLRVYGITVCRIATVLSFNQEDLHSGSDIETIRELRRLLLELGKSQSVRAKYNSDERFLEACCRNLWLNNFGDRWIPALPQAVSHDDCFAVLKNAQGSDRAGLELPNLRTIPHCLERLRENCAARVLFITEDGMIGTAVDSTTVGDDVCFLFGSDGPSVLRSVASTASSSCAYFGSEYCFVGECYVDGAMYGEFILGALSEDLYKHVHLHPPDSRQPMTLVDDVIYEQDSRTESFLKRLKDKQGCQ